MNKRFLATLAFAVIATALFLIWATVVEVAQHLTGWFAKLLH